jgi:hypothetical protein
VLRRRQQRLLRRVGTERDGIQAFGCSAATAKTSFLRSTPSAPFMHFVAAFQQGLKEEGFVEGQNVAIEYRWPSDRQ